MRMAGLKARRDILWGRLRSPEGIGEAVISLQTLFAEGCMTLLFEMWKVQTVKEIVRKAYILLRIHECSLYGGDQFFQDSELVTTIWKESKLFFIEH